MSERKKRQSHFPLTIDTLGGVRLAEFSLQNGGLSLTREVKGADWRISSGEGKGRINVEARGDSLMVGFQLPLMFFEYSRGMGALKEILVSGVDLAALAGTKLALAKGDWGNLEDQKQCFEDRLIRLVFTADGIEAAVVKSERREVVGVESEKEENLGLSRFGFLPDQPNYAWTGDLGFLAGRVGFEVWPDKVKLFYEKEGGGRVVRREVMEVPRTITGAGKIDWAVTQGMPSEDDLLVFLEEVYLPRL